LKKFIFSDQTTIFGVQIWALKMVIWSPKMIIFQKWRTLWSHAFKGRENTPKRTPIPKEKFVQFLAPFLEIFKKFFCKNSCFSCFFNFSYILQLNFEEWNFFWLFIKLWVVRKNALEVQLTNPLGSGWDNLCTNIS
jgi:hypothetical protein